jgi:hypothetical protein
MEPQIRAAQLPAFVALGSACTCLCRGIRLGTFGQCFRCLARVVVGVAPSGQHRPVIPGRAGDCDHLVHVFAFSSLLVAIQVASAQLTPRIIATTLLRDSTIRSVVALFVLTLSFGLMTLARSQTEVQYLLLSCAVALGAASTAAFIYLIDYAARLLRPVSMCGAWARRGSGSSSRFIRRR